MPENKEQEHLFASVAGYRKVQSLAHRLKRGDESGVREAAALMAGAVSTLAEGRSAVLVPIPGLAGRATYTKDLCEEIGRLTALPTADLLQGRHHLPLYEAKKNDMKPEGIRISYTLRAPLPEGATAILVDNVLDTGHTAWAAVKAVGRADTRLAVLGHTGHYTLNRTVNFTQVKVENMVNKKQEEVKQVSAAQRSSKAAAEKKTATTKKAADAAGEKTKDHTLEGEYQRMKERHPDAILLFRSGDFYKSLNTDAAKVAETLGLALIKPRDPKNGHLMAGFPYHALDTYLPKLIRAGLRVAIVEELGKNKRADKAESQEAGKEKAEGKEEAPKTMVKPEAWGDTKKAEAAEAKTEQKEPRAPQLVTVNGEKVTHAHAFQSTKYPDTWYFTARLEGKQLRPMVMNPKDVEAYKEKKVTVPYLMNLYYPTKMEKKVTPEQYKADMVLSDGRVIEKMNVFKEKDENREDFGKYKLFAQVQGQDKGMAAVMTTQDLNAFFDRVTTPRVLVEKNFGERLGLASAYEKYKLPEGAPVSDIRIAKDKDGEWRISAQVGDAGRTDRKILSRNDRASFFDAKTVTREQLAAKYLTPDIEKAMGRKEEVKAGLKV